MHKYILFFITAVLLLSSPASASPLQCGDKFPDVDLQGKQSPQHLNYLGLQGEGPWKIMDINAEFILVEVYSMYCPHCQKEAPSVNTLFDELKNSDLAKRIKLIGIGAGNSEFEVEFFRKKFKVEFPLFTDVDLTIHAKVGATGTPHFYLVQNSGNSLKTVFSHAGRMDNPSDFLKEIIKAAETE